MLVSDPRGQWEVGRFQGKGARLIAPDGRVLEEDALRALLGRIDGAIFKDVFAFSLWELSNLEALSQEEVRDRLYRHVIRLLKEKHLLPPTRLGLPETSHSVEPAEAEVS